MSFENFFDSYLETAVWSSNDWSDMEGDNPAPMDKKYSVEDFAKVTKAHLRKDAEDFYKKNEHLWADDNSDSHAGHDFWLTRNGHGAGFWDGDYVNGDELSKASKQYGEEDLYVSRGKIRADKETRVKRSR